MQSSVIEEAKPFDPSGRRTFLRRMAGAGAAVVGAIAVTWADAPIASAAPACCDLYYPNGPWCGGSPNNDGHFSCPRGTSKHVWYCRAGHFIYHCWECNSGSTCWTGSFKCSNYWEIYIP
jgi:hypothetical protein